MGAPRGRALRMSWFVGPLPERPLRGAPRRWEEQVRAAAVACRRGRRLALRAAPIGGAPP
eukprot:9576467-Alexandrium_andersonii.AAC.1